MARRAWRVSHAPPLRSRSRLPGSVVNRVAYPAPGRDVPLRVWGPRGTAKMMSHLEQAYEFDIRIRLYDDRAHPDGVVILAADISEGVVYEQGGVKITAVSYT